MNEQWVIEEIRRKINKFKEMDEHENTFLKTLQDKERQFTVKFTTLSLYQIAGKDPVS